MLSALLAIKILFSLPAAAAVGVWWCVAGVVKCYAQPCVDFFSLALFPHFPVFFGFCETVGVLLLMSYYYIKLFEHNRHLAN
jgi:hypothetical protein